MKDINDVYLDRYRRRLSDLKDIENEIVNLRDRYDRELAVISDRQMRVKIEIREMRQVITTMIDQGCDSVEAKLRNEQESAENIWDTITWDKITTEDSYGSGHTHGIGMADLSTSIDLTQTIYDPYITVVDKNTSGSW